MKKTIPLISDKKHDERDTNRECPDFVTEQAYREKYIHDTPKD
jgi:hypothetical protein